MISKYLQNIKICGASVLKLRKYMTADGYHFYTQSKVSCL